MGIKEKYKEKSMLKSYSLKEGVSSFTIFNC